MTNKEIEAWFVSLPVKRKEHIAAKVLLKEGKDVHEARYPNCYNIWKELSDEVKSKIHDHCTNDHGDWIQEGGDATIFSY